MNPSSDRSGADWIAWVLQVAFGAFIGGLFGLGLIAQRRSGFWRSADVIAVYLWGGRRWSERGCPGCTETGCGLRAACG